MESVSRAPRLRRSVLFVPGGAPRKIDRARASAADTIVLDLEDATRPERKPEARACVAEALQAGGFGASELAVRINPPDTPFFEEDVAAMVAAGARTVMLPKAERPASIQSVAARLGGETNLLLLIESPLGVADALSVGAATSQAEGLCFGHADFSLQMGLPRAEASNPVVHHARCSVAIAAKAHEIAPIDCVHLDVRDDRAFRADTEVGLSIGYEGRLCIHPRQAEIANEVYTPSDAQVEYARRVLDGWERAREDGTGVFTIDGKLVDAPVIAQQRRLLARAAIR